MKVFLAQVIAYLEHTCEGMKYEKYVNVKDILPLSQLYCKGWWDFSAHCQSCMPEMTLLAEASILIVTSALWEVLADISSKRVTTVGAETRLTAWRTGPSRLLWPQGLKF